MKWIRNLRIEIENQFIQQKNTFCFLLIRNLQAFKYRFTANFTCKEVVKSVKCK